MNLNSIQLNLNPIVELKLVDLELNLVEFKFNSSCIAMSFTLQFQIGMNEFIL